MSVLKKQAKDSVRKETASTYPNLFAECSDCNNDISCFRKIAGVLSDVEIKKLGLIVGGKKQNFNPTVYDLSLGSFHYVYGGHNNKSWIPVCVGSDNELREHNNKLDESERFIRQDNNNTTTLTIPALGSALAINSDAFFDTGLTHFLIKKMRQKMRQTNFQAIKKAKFLTNMCI